MRLIGVGVGPGDPELVTLKAVRVLATAGRVFVPVLDPGDTGRAESSGRLDLRSAQTNQGRAEPSGRLDLRSAQTNQGRAEPSGRLDLRSAQTNQGRAEATVLAHVAHDRIERLVFALNERTDAARRERHWDAAGERVAGWLRETGGTAAFATIGDPNLYSTFGYLAETVSGLLPGVVVETVPGITAMQALAAASGVPLVEGTEPLTLLPLARSADPLRAAVAGDGTVVVYKGGRHLPEIAAIAKEAGRDAVYGEHLGLPDERVGRLSDVDGQGPYLATVLLPANRTARGGKL
jgi:precorrin-2/cobalt-factor-2 C20-methyltransferase